MLPYWRAYKTGLPGTNVYDGAIALAGLLFLVAALYVGNLGERLDRAEARIRNLQEQQELTKQCHALQDTASQYLLPDR